MLSVCIFNCMSVALICLYVIYVFSSVHIFFFFYQLHRSVVNTWPLLGLWHKTYAKLDVR